MTRLLLLVIIVFAIANTGFASVCVVDSWGAWGDCIGNCQFGLRVRNRDVLRPPFPERTSANRLAIRPCAELYQVRVCLPHPCPGSRMPPPLPPASNISTFINDLVGSRNEEEREAEAADNQDQVVDDRQFVVQFNDTERTNVQIETKVNETNTAANWSPLDKQLPPAGLPNSSLIRVLNSPSISQLGPDATTNRTGSTNAPSANATSEASVAGTSSGPVSETSPNAQRSEGSTTKITSSTSTETPESSSVDGGQPKSTTRQLSGGGDTDEKKDSNALGLAPNPDDFLLNTSKNDSTNPCGSRNGNPRCCRRPMKNLCPSGSAPQTVIRWMRRVGDSECNSYLYSYCGLRLELEERPIKFEEECYEICYSSDEKQSLSLFQLATFSNGFRTDNRRRS